MDAALYRRLVAPILVLLAGITGVGTIVAGVAYLRTWFAMDYVAGAWMALAQHVNQGTFYPALYDGQVFGGTRNMPVFFVLHAVTARVTGEYLASGKLLSLVILVALVGLVVAALRQLRCPWPLAVGLAALLPLTRTGLLAGLTIRGDALAVVWQLAATVLVAGTGGAAALIAAAALCALGTLTKLSAVWAPLAIGVWLLLRDRRGLLVFAVAYGALVVGGLAILEVASGGHMLDNVLGLAGSDLRAAGVVGRVGGKTLGLLSTYATATWLLVPFAAASCAIAATRRDLTVHHLAWLAAGAVLLVVMADGGTYQNHLIDVVALTPIAAGGLWLQTRTDARPGAAATLLALAALWGAGTGLVLSPGAELRAAGVALVRGTPAATTLDELLGELPSEATVLSEDPGILVARGQTPTVLDPFMLTRAAQGYPEIGAALRRRIAAQEFEVVVLLHRFEELDDATYRDWYATGHFGDAVMDALCEAYRWEREVDGFHLYRPGPEPDSSCR